ncbi:uncharacterized protein LOC114277800 [Camellia sinensis]|uniref:uncharacterized protein LOC114277800 n=1 Tax=Camellia sinensis TaxID=4442 RepID=UPI001035A37E|nr:uncharacterized protein LOC114277800 [Camellia sinensis]
MAPIEALYGRPCRSPICWTEVGDANLVGPKLVLETTEKVKLIRQRLKTAQDRQKNYADRRRRPLMFEVGNHVFLKVQPRRGVVRFGRKGKLSRPFEVLEGVGEVAYRLALPSQLAGIHSVFHVSMLRKYIADPSHVLKWEDISLDKDVTFKEGPVAIQDSREKNLRGKTVHLVKVLWRHWGIEESTWERQDWVKANYPELFEGSPQEDSPKRAEILTTLKDKQKQKKKRKLILTPEESESQIEEGEIEKEQEVSLQRQKRKHMTVAPSDSIEDPTHETTARVVEKALTSD